MRLPSIPGPGDVLAAVDGVRGGIADALALVPRLGVVVGRIEGLLDRVTGLVDRVDSAVGRAEAALDALDTTRERADRAIDRVQATQARADGAIDRVEATQAKADRAVTAVDRTTAGAGEALARAEGLLDGVTPLMGAYREPLRQLAPSVRRLAETLAPAEVEALVTLVDRLPGLLRQVDENVLPMLTTLGNVGEDVHELLDTMQDVREVVKGFPGAKLFRRRAGRDRPRGRRGGRREGRGQLRRPLAAQVSVG